MNVSLTLELEKFIQNEIGSGFYQTASEVVRAGLRKLKDEKKPHPAEAPATEEQLEKWIQESIDSLDRGEGIDGKKMFRELRKEISQAKRRRG
jgi:antitoxin ParD1/3/4